MTAPTRREALLGTMALMLAGCGSRVAAQAQARAATPRARALIETARRQVGVTLLYDPDYSRLPYPGGDVPRFKGVCTDVVVRAYRDAFGIDLQRDVHEDMAGHFAAYPHKWGLPGPDSNIDHRRVPNLATFWTRAHSRLPIPAKPLDWQPGDLFTQLIDGLHTHVGIVSDRVALNGNPLVIHNIGAGAREEDKLFAYQLTGRFRWRV